MRVQTRTKKGFWLLHSCARVEVRKCERQVQSVKKKTCVLFLSVMLQSEILQMPHYTRYPRDLRANQVYFVFVFFYGRVIRNYHALKKSQSIL